MECKKAALATPLLDGALAVWTYDGTGLGCNEQVYHKDLVPAAQCHLTLAQSGCFSSHRLWLEAGAKASFPDPY